MAPKTAMPSKVHSTLKSLQIKPGILSGYLIQMDVFLGILVLFSPDLSKKWLFPAIGGC